MAKYKPYLKPEWGVKKRICNMVLRRTSSLDMNYVCYRDDKHAKTQTKN